MIEAKASLRAQRVPMILRRQDMENCPIRILSCADKRIRLTCERNSEEKAPARLEASEALGKALHVIWDMFKNIKG
jgi:molybdenum cofactor biosynthesis enzyme